MTGKKYFAWLAQLHFNRGFNYKLNTYPATWPYWAKEYYRDKLMDLSRKETNYPVW